MPKLIRHITFAYLIFSISYTYAQLEVCTTCEYKTVTEAIENAKPHSTILIEKGIYKEHNILIDKPINIIGKNTH